MKILSSLFVFLASSAALAYPSIGDYAMMNGTATQNGVSTKISLERTIMDFEAETNKYVVVETQTADGQAQTITLIENGDDLITKEQVSGVLLYCGQFGGALETITVAAGTFSTCKMTTKDENDQPSGTAWIGDVAFGIVKVQGTHEGAPFSLELTSFHSAR